LLNLIENDLHPRCGHKTKSSICVNEGTPFVCIVFSLYIIRTLANCAGVVCLSFALGVVAAFITVITVGSMINSPATIT